MHRWSKVVPRQEEADWEAKLQLLGVFACFHDVPGAADLRIEAFVDDPSLAARLAGVWGGALEEVGDRDWVEVAAREWRGHVLPVRDRVLVTLDDRPGFLETLRAEHPDRELLVFPPGVAFGTGDHATTATCLDWLVREADEGRLSGRDVLDLGCGTGILGIAAAKLGAARVLGIDHDPLAVAAAREYWSANGAPGGAEVRWEEADVLSWVAPAPFDLVLANLYSEVLREALPGIRAAVKVGGRVILSGILAEQAAGVVEAAESAGLTLRERSGPGTWTTLLWSRPGEP
jgi:ribosomal protein L11 methyltransferase